MARKYVAMRTLSGIYRVLGTIVAVITLLIAISLCSASVLGGAAIDNFARNYGLYTNIAGITGGLVTGLVLSGLALLYGGLMTVVFFAVAEGLSLLIAVEENTRATARMLESTIGFETTVEEPAPADQAGQLE
jgi:hypothetical protein